MIDTSVFFADLSSGDEFESNQYCCANSKRYLKLSATFQNGIAGYANAVEMQNGDPALFEPEDGVTLIRSASDLTESNSNPERRITVKTGG
jgi:hypothetical protein